LQIFFEPGQSRFERRQIPGCHLSAFAQIDPSRVAADFQCDGGPRRGQAGFFDGGLFLADVFAGRKAGKGIFAAAAAVAEFPAGFGRRVVVGAPKVRLALSGIGRQTAAAFEIDGFLLFIAQDLVEISGRLPMSVVQAEVHFCSGRSCALLGEQTDNARRACFAGRLESDALRIGARGEKRAENIFVSPARRFLKRFVVRANAVLQEDQSRVFFPARQCVVQQGRAPGILQVATPPDKKFDDRHGFGRVVPVNDAGQRRPAFAVGPVDVRAVFHQERNGFKGEIAHRFVQGRSSVRVRGVDRRAFLKQERDVGRVVAKRGVVQESFSAGQAGVHVFLRQDEFFHLFGIGRDFFHLRARVAEKFVKQPVARGFSR